MFATSSSDATAMAWNWVIQSISKFKQVDSPTLAGLVDRAPEISVDIGKDAKEVVSLRMLQSLFPHGNDATADLDSSQNAEISIDSSEHCEDILNRILKETSESMTGLKRRKWNIHPFIIHKDASLPETPMQKLKEALLESNHSVLDSLKQMSKAAKVCGNTILKTENAIRKLQECPLQKPHHVEDSNKECLEDIGRKEHEMTIEPPENDLLADDNVDHGQLVSHGEDDEADNDLVFLKKDNVNSKLKKHPLQKPDHVQDTNKGITEETGRKEQEMTTLPTEHDNDDDNVDHGQQPPCEADDNENVDHGQQTPCEDDNVSVDHGQQQPNDDDGDDDEMTDIAAKKEAFLSSQFTLSQDFVSSVDFTETYLCVKCNKGGQLLVCNSDACPFRVHERCLGSAATYDENEVFFCPFCSYSHALSKYMEVKKKASLARKDLQAFLTSGVKYRPNISSKTDKHIKLNGGERLMSRGKGCASVDSDHQSTGQAGVAKQPSESKESPVSSTSSHSKRARKREPQYTSTTVILPRRRNLFWEKSEEEKLKEGMEKFSSEDYKRIPWKKILDFGRDVFDKSRTTIDLKDKWRNMCKESPAVKKQKL